MVLKEVSVSVVGLVAFFNMLTEFLECNVDTIQSVWEHSEETRRYNVYPSENKYVFEKSAVFKNGEKLV